MKKQFKKLLKHQNKNYSLIDTLIGSGRLPDFVIRLGIKFLNKRRLQEHYSLSSEIRHEKLKEFMLQLKTGPISVNTKTTNAQHYELPTEFFKIVLGPKLKYSCSYFNSKKDTLAEADENMLNIYLQRAKIKNSDEILELGCGWGSLTVYMATQFPKSKITAISNSSVQKKYIDQLLKKRKIKNVNVITSDFNDFSTQKKFDKVVSIEMFEHIRNYEKAFQKVHSFLKKGGQCFIHIFAHREIAYPFEVKDDSDWMSKYFFTGGTMPSNHLFTYFCHPLKINDHWVVNGKQYTYTADKWLENMDANKERVLKIFQDVYEDEYKIWYQYWRIFFMSVAELFGYKNGNEWVINHYLFEKV